MSKVVPYPARKRDFLKRFPLHGLVMTAAVVVLLGAVVRVQVVRIDQVCSGLKAWRLALRDDDLQNLPLAPGVYTATTYSLANAFGLIGMNTPTTLITMAPAQ